MPQPWQPDFDFYMTMIEDRPASIVLDLNAGPESPLDTHPILIVIRVPMKSPNAEGLRQESELEALGKLEDDFTERLADAVDAIYVGRTVCDGDTTLYFYAPQRSLDKLEDLPALLAGVAGVKWSSEGGDPGDYEPDCSVDEDPDWNLYNELLAPGPYESQTIWNRRLLAVFEEKGDRLDVPREIDHFADFPTKEQAERAAAALRAKGFTTDDLDPPENDDEPWSLQFHRSEPLSGGRPDEFVSEILDVILEEDGAYDGWGASHVGATSSE